MAKKANLGSAWPVIDSGEFRHTIFLMEPTIESDPIAGAIGKYALVNPPVTAQVKIDYMRGAEVFKSGQDISQVFVNMTGWFRAQFNPGCHVQTNDGDEFIVQYVENVKRMNTYMVLSCIGFGLND